MAKIRARQGKQQMEAKKPMKRGPTSTADAQKTKSMDAVLGIEPINFSEDEGEGEKGVRSTQIASMADLFKPPLSPRSSLQEIQKQEEISRDFEYFLSANRDCAASIQQGNNTTLPILRSGTVVKGWLNWKIESIDLDAMLRWIERSKAGKFRQSFWLAVMAAMVYQIWRARNLALWESEVPIASEVVRKIKEEVKSRFFYVWPKKM
uniref:Uncharacterized protein n=1 Tax=Cannabis sativa TaxID=3483 RepID=A0A803QHI7_CANSA